MLGAVIRHYSSPGYVEKRISAAVGPGYHVNIGTTHYNPLRRSFNFHDVSVVPDTLRTPVPAGFKQPRKLSSFAAGSVRASGVDLWTLYKGNIDVDEILIDKPEIHLSINRAVPDDDPHKPRRMPHQVLGTSDTHLRIDKIRVIDGDIRYSEQAIDGSRFGMFRFADLDLTITHLTNDTTRMDHPCVIDARTRLANSGPLHATFEYDLSSPETRMDYRAVIGRMDATSLNKLLVDLKGIRVTEGVLDSTTLNFKIDGDVATGTMKLIYHDLKFEIMDKDDHDQDLKHHFATLMQNRKVHSSNPPDDDEPATVVTVRRERLPHISLMKFVWESAREGMLRSIGAL